VQGETKNRNARSSTGPVDLRPQRMDMCMYGDGLEWVLGSG